MPVQLNYSTFEVTLVFWDHNFKPVWSKTLSSTNENVQDELTRRHKAAATTVVGLAVATVLVGLIAYLGRDRFRQDPNQSIDVAARITIFVLGMGSIVWRRTKFSAARLQDIAALAGGTGLISTLEKTTIQVSLMAAVIVIIGFIATVLTGNEFYTYAGALIGLVVLLISYPTKSSWMKTVARFTENPNTPPLPPPDLGA